MTKHPDGQRLPPGWIILFVIFSQIHNRMNLVQFSGWTLAGSAVWNTILVTAGYVLGDNWCSILGVLNVFEDIVIGVVIAIILVCIVVRARKLVAGRRARRSGNESVIPEERREQ